MNDGARWHKLYARGDPFQADDDGSAQHLPPKAALWCSSRSSHIDIRHPRGCYVLGRERRTLQSALCSSCSTRMRCYHWREIGFVCFLKTDQISRGNASAFFSGYFFGLTHTVPEILNTPQTWRPSHHHHHQQTSSLRSPYELHMVVLSDPL
jgi:hypothetical protein